MDSGILMIQDSILVCSPDPRIPHTALAKCPVIWVSRRQAKMALSTMMVEYIALLTAKSSPHMGLSEDTIATIQAKTMVHKDNNGAMRSLQTYPQLFNNNVKKFQC
jgi:hypothetical protein